MSSSVPAQRLALVTVLRSVLPDAAVTYGRPTRLETRMAWLGVSRVPQNTQPTSSGNTRRSRREEVEVDVVLSCYVPGSPSEYDDAQQAATDGAYAMLDELDGYFRTVSSPPLAPGCMPSIVSSHESEILPVTDNTDTIRGWTCDITATVSTTATV